MDSLFHKITLECGLPAFKNNVKAERDHLLQRFNPLRVKNKHLKKLMLQKDAVMKEISTCIIGT